MAKFSKNDLMAIGTEVIGLTAGGTASRFVQNKLVQKVTFVPEKFRPLLSVAAGVLIRKTVGKKEGVFAEIGRGMISDGGSHFVSQMVPQLAGLSDDDMNGIGDKVDDVLDNILSGDDGIHDDEVNDDMGDDEVNDDLSDDMGDDGVHDDMNDDTSLEDDLNGVDDGIHSEEFAELEY